MEIYRSNGSPPHHPTQDEKTLLNPPAQPHPVSQNEVCAVLDGNTESKGMASAVPIRSDHGPGFSR